MRNFIILFIVGLAISVSSCRQDFDFEPSTGGLTFSKDTVYLDTVFTNIGSSTYTLKVYNKSDKDIAIPTIQLAKGLDSKYRMTVDGMTGENNRIFHDVELLAKDSMYIFIEVTADVAEANPTDFLYTDKIEFRHANGNIQDVDVVTLIQDAYFLYPKRFSDGTTETLPIGDDEIYGFYLDHSDPVNGDEYVWSNDKPYVIYGYAAVPNGETLNVQPGARVHFHADSGLIIGNGGTLKVNGQLSTTEALENEVIFEGDRLEPGFSDVPGQWGTVWLTDGSTNNEINHLTLKNAVVGLLIDHNDGTTTTIKNTQIYDCSNMGIYAKTAKIYGENLVINSAGQATLACTLGGSYEFRHCTFNNNWSSSRQVAVLLNNYYDDDAGVRHAFDLTQADFKNCIIYGGNSFELSLDPDTSEDFNYSFTKCVMKFGTSSNPLYSWIYNNPEIKRSEDPKFLDVNNNKLNIGDDSSARGFGNNVGVATDILGNLRSDPYDAGAYNWTTFPQN